MSIKVQTFVWDNSKQKSTKLVMMLAIADYCDDDGGCFPGQLKLAGRARFENTKSVSGVVNKLAANGELTIIRRPGHSNYYFVREYCISQGLVLDDLLKNYGLKGPLEIVGGWQLGDTSDDDPTPHQTMDNPPSDDDPTPHQTMDNPPSDGDTYPSVNHQSESSEETSVKSSSSTPPPTPDDEDDEFIKKFELSNNDISIIRETFRGLTKMASELLTRNRDLTIEASRYVLATQIWCNPDSHQYVKLPSRYVFAVVKNGALEAKFPKGYDFERMLEIIAERNEKIARQKRIDAMTTEEKEACYSPISEDAISDDPVIDQAYIDWKEFYINNWKRLTDDNRQKRIEFRDSKLPPYVRFWNATRRKVSSMSLRYANNIKNATAIGYDRKTQTVTVAVNNSDEKWSCSTWIPLKQEIQTSMNRECGTPVTLKFVIRELENVNAS